MTKLLTRTDLLAAVGIGLLIAATLHPALVKLLALAFLTAMAVRVVVRLVRAVRW